jgi:protein-S-isoprenylcysteine O-methyltransferase Ste14
MGTQENSVPAGILGRAAISAIVFWLVLAAILFVPAGIGWRRGLAFFIVFITLMVLSSAYLWRKNPEIFVARSRAHTGAKIWDKVLVPLILGSFVGIFVLSALDARFGWSSVPLWVTAVGYVVFALGYAGTTWVCAVNPFAEPTVRIQMDRGQRVIDTGPYAIVRHPMYVASFFLVVGMPLAMGSYWALIPVGVGVIVIIVRTALEDRVLQNELDGYKDYALRVRYRLIPGVW